MTDALLALIYDHPLSSSHVSMQSPEYKSVAAKVACVAGSTNEEPAGNGNLCASAVAKSVWLANQSGLAGMDKKVVLAVVQHPHGLIASKTRTQLCLMHV